MYGDRLRAARRNAAVPSRPHNFFTRFLAASTALLRETANVSLPRLAYKRFSVTTLPIGVLALISGNLVLLVVLCFYRLDPAVHDNFQNIAYRCGFLSLGQMPLLFLLAGKNNLIGAFTGHSYYRLNKLHRYVSRTLLITVTLHMGYWFGDWAPYDYIGYQIKNDRNFTQTGLAAWAVLVWIVFSSFAPIRNWSYEFFYVQHILSFVAFMAMVFIHTPAEDHGWLWAGIAVFVLDRVIRGLRMLYINLALFHPLQRAEHNMRSLWACNAELTPLPDRMTRITIRDPPIKWKPGQHAFISCHSVAPLQGHPFTISSLPSDGELEFMVKAQNGGTRRLYDYAQKRLCDLPITHDHRTLTESTVSAVISGPYGQMRSLRQFDSVVLLAGSSGASFTMPLLRDLINHWQNPNKSALTALMRFMDPSGIVTRRIRLVWVVRSGSQSSWFAKQLNTAMADVLELRKAGNDVRLHASVYVTCDERFTAFQETNTTSSEWNRKPHSDEKQANGIVEQWQSSPESSSTSSLDKTEDEKKPKRDSANLIDVHEVDPRSEQVGSGEISHKIQTDRKTCGPDGTCCCQTTVTDEDADAIAQDAVCQCNCEHNLGTSSASSGPATPIDPDTEKSAPDVSSRPSPQGSLHTNIALLSGRPHLRTVIRKVLEQAEGESAVVVCGPSGMNHDVRRATVGLSDERAAGRGTGALGVWFWNEGFGW